VNFITQPVDHPTLEPAYRAELVVRLLQELVEDPRTFENLVRASEGAYPSDVMSALRWLEAKDKVFLSQSGLWTRSPEGDSVPTNETSNGQPSLMQASNGLPEPHPLDYDWRFTYNTLAHLAGRLRASPVERVAILGAPTLYKYLADSGVVTWLFDKNPHVIQHFIAAEYPSVTQANLLEFPDFEAQFQWAVADPPWYPEHYAAFLTAARKLLVLGGKLLLSVLPRLTRPSASTDRIRILECAANLGFDLFDVELGSLHYASPPFEVEALRAEGLVVENWRAGDLYSFVLRSREDYCVNRIEASDEEHWQTLQLGETTIKIKLERRSEPELFSYQPASCTSDLRLRSVSRRSPVRSRINLWTSRNIALMVSKPMAVADALDEIGKGRSPATTLAHVSHKYQLAETEKRRLREVIELLILDAGLTWND
jgi:hypothetical protein